MIWSGVTRSGGGRCRRSRLACSRIEPGRHVQLGVRLAAGDAGDLVEQLVELEHLRAAQLVALADRLGPLERRDERGRHVAHPDRLVAVAAVADHRRERQPDQPLELGKGASAAGEHEARLEHRPVEVALDHRLLGAPTWCASSG